VAGGMVGRGLALFEDGGVLDHGVVVAVGVAKVLRLHL
jgi:hypothetical protein